MNINLVIVESPAKAKTITKYLGKDYKTCASYGHICEIPSKTGSVNPDDNFSINYEVPTKSMKYLNEIIKNCKNVDKIFLATDPDREGEAIAYHIVEELQKRNAIPEQTIVKRITFNSITKNEILHAVANPREIDQSLVEAQKARRALDYLVGFNLSPVLWRKIPGSMSAGRVQSVALRLICERDQEIFQFKSEEFWNIDGLFLTEQKEEFKAKLTHFNRKKLEKFTINSEEISKKFVQTIKKQKFFIKEIKKKKGNSSPPPPFTTSTLQQDASSKLGFSPKRTMQIAQKLYEGIKIDKETTGLITYMRTDGVYINADVVKQMRGFISDKFGVKYLSPQIRTYKSKVKNAQEAHEAIRSTNINRTPEEMRDFLTEEQFKLYNLVWARTIASQMHNAVFDQTNIVIHSDDGSSILQASGSILTFDGFQKIYSTRDKDSILPECTQDEQLQIKKIDDTQNFTQPPAQFSEASLIKKLEELGIGRPSTYTTILTVLQDRKYVVLTNRKLIPEERGKIVSAFLCQFFAQYVNYQFTANLEDQLDEVSNGDKDWIAVLQDFWQDFIKLVGEVMAVATEDVAEVLNENLTAFLFPQDVENPRQCPDCKTGKMGIRCSKFGVFLGCNNYPECRCIKNIGDANQDAVNSDYPKEIGEDENGEKITLCKGPYGLYVQRDAADIKKIKRMMLPKSLPEEHLTLESARKLIALPLTIGIHPETQKEIKVGLGKFGAYILYDEMYVSVKNEMEIFDLSPEDAIKKINEHLAKMQKNLVRNIGIDKKNIDINLYKNRFGHFLLHGNKRVKLPRNFHIEELTIDLLYEKKIIKDKK